MAEGSKNRKLGGLFQAECMLGVCLGVSFPPSPLDLIGPHERPLNRPLPGAPLDDLLAGCNNSHSSLTEAVDAQGQIHEKKLALCLVPGLVGECGYQESLTLGTVKNV